ESITVDYSTLNQEQRQVHDSVIEHFLECQAQLELEINERIPVKPLLMIVSGIAGSGKSYTIHAINTSLNRMNREADSYSILCVTAFTGVAAFNINGVTLHSLIQLGLKENDPVLTPARLLELQLKLQYIRYIIVDEMSMISSTLLARIDNRLRQIFPQNSCQPFGGCSIILIGDFAQLPPVGGRPMYCSPNSNSSLLAIQGFSLYRMFTKAYNLHQIVQQNGSNNSQSQFREILIAARNGLWTTEFWQLLISARTLLNLPQWEQDSFQNVTRLYPTNFENLGHPVAGVLSRVPADETGELQQHLRLAIGARLMIRRNLWTQHGIVNGSLGTLRGIVWQNQAVDDDLPKFLLVEIDSYTGPPFLESAPKQFPITLAGAMTVQKSQGLTLDKAVIELGKREMVNGLTFVAISRVRRIADLAFITTVPFDRVNRIRE
ncbi:unnamed protein product, partial [Tuber aestivum]